MKIIDNTSYEEIINSFKNSFNMIKNDKKEIVDAIKFIMLFFSIGLAIEISFCLIAANINIITLQFFFIFYAVIIFLALIIMLFMIFTSLSTIKDINKKIKEYEQIDKNNTDMENKAKKIIEKNIVNSKILKNKDIYNQLIKNKINNYKIDKENQEITISYIDNNKEIIDLKLCTNIHYFDELEEETIIINNNTIETKVKY